LYCFGCCLKAFEIEPHAACHAHVPLPRHPNPRSTPHLAAQKFHFIAFDAVLEQSPPAKSALSLSFPLSARRVSLSPQASMMMIIIVIIMMISFQQSEIAYTPDVGTSQIIGLVEGDA
jgi:hypothetical protein